MSFSFNKFLMDIAAKPEEGDGITPFSPPSSHLPRPQGALSDGSRALDAPLEVPRTPEVNLLEEHARNGSSPSKVIFSRAEDFIAATLSNLSLQNSSHSESPAPISNKPEEERNRETDNAAKLPVGASTSLAPGMSEAEYVFKALSLVPPDMRYRVIPSLVKNLTLKTYGDVRVSDSISSPIMSVRCQLDSSRSAIPDSIENAAAQVLEANFDTKMQPSMNIEGLVSTVLSVTQAFRKIEDIAAPQGTEDSDGDSKKTPLTADDIVEIVGPIKFEEEKPREEKVWREGMMLKDNKEDTSKTVFMTQNLNKQYEKDDVKKSRTSFEIAAAKITREVGYFSKILDRAGSDMRDTEYSLDPIRVLDARQKAKDELLKLKGDIDVFISSNLEGDIREKPAEKIVKESISSVKVEYVYPNEKKLQGKEQKIVASPDSNQMHVCTDCNEEIVVTQGSNLEEELLKHTHNNDSSTGTIVKSSIKVADKKERKANEAKHKRAMFLNKLVPCLIDDNLFSCLPCGINLESDNAVLADHMDSDAHMQNLNQYNTRVQKDLINQNPDLFGPNKLFYLTDLHIVMNKIFVDPMSKYAYCGLCKKELPPRQQNVEEHIKSKGHDKLLLDFLEGRQPTIVSNRSQILDGAEVKTAQMLDMTEQPAIDISQLEKLLETKARKKSPQQESDEMEIASNSSDGKYDHIYRTPDKKHVCLICDSRNIPNQNALDAHHSGALHKKNLDASKNVRNGLTPDQQALMVQNGIAVSYGKVPLIFECLSCGTSYANYETMLRHFNGPHIQNLARVRSKQAVPIKKNNVKGFNRVILHRNGTEFWCFKCRMTLPNIGAAFEHVKLPGHEDSVDGVKYTTATQFYCGYCMVKINGERNVGQHVMGPKHKSFASADNNPAPNKMRANSESNSAPSFSRAQVKKQKDEKNSAYQGEQHKTQAPYQMELPKTDEGILLQKNGVLELPNGMYDCAFCGTGPVTRSEIFHHIFSFDHMTKMSKLGAR